MKLNIFNIWAVCILTAQFSFAQINFENVPFSSAFPITFLLQHRFFSKINLFFLNNQLIFHLHRRQFVLGRRISPQRLFDRSNVAIVTIQWPALRGQKLLRKGLKGRDLLQGRGTDLRP